MNRKFKRRSEAEILTDILIVQMEMELADVQRRSRIRDRCPPGWARVDRKDSVRPRKVSLTLSIDRDVATWFWQQGQEYQARMNAVLRTLLTKQAETV